jgi:hypothetical protein
MKALFIWPTLFLKRAKYTVVTHAAHSGLRLAKNPGKNRGCVG